MFCRVSHIEVNNHKVSNLIKSVTLAKVDQVKREMAYHGDTINAPARKQEEGNNYHVNLLISAEARNVLTLNDFSALRSLGSLKLRGRKEDIEVFTM